MGISDEFKKFGAKQKNIQWSVSAFNDKDELVVSIWGHPPLVVFNKESRIQIYKDKVSRWSGLGNQEFRKNIEIAYLKNLKVRPIITLSKNFEEILNNFLKEGVKISRKESIEDIETPTKKRRSKINEDVEKAKLYFKTNE